MFLNATTALAAFLWHCRMYSAVWCILSGDIGGKLSSFGDGCKLSCVGTLCVGTLLCVGKLCVGTLCAAKSKSFVAKSFGGTPIYLYYILSDYYILTDI